MPGPGNAVRWREEALAGLGVAGGGEVEEGVGAEAGEVPHGLVGVRDELPEVARFLFQEPAVAFESLSYLQGQCETLDG